MNPKIKIVMLALLTGIVQVVIAVTMIGLWVWLFDGIFRSVLIVITTALSIKSVYGQIPWAKDKINRLNND
jgi:hypothetical protein